MYLPLTSSHLDLIVFFRYTDPARRTERSWEGSSTMRRRLGRNEGCALRAARFCSACFLVDGFKDANSSWGTSDMFAGKRLKEPAWWQRQGFVEPRPIVAKFGHSFLIPPSSSSWPPSLSSWTATGHRTRLRALRPFQTRFPPISPQPVSRHTPPDVCFAPIALILLSPPHRLQPPSALFQEHRRPLVQVSTPLRL